MNNMSLKAEFSIDYTYYFVCTAIHNGHYLRPEVENNCRPSETERFREEDPYTDFFTEICPSRVIVQTSRFEVDMNRKRDKAVYLRPNDCWGLNPRKKKPSQEEMKGSLSEYDVFYKQMKEILTKIINKHGKAIVFDIHSYTDVDDPNGAIPTINLGLSNMAEKWLPLVYEMKDTIKAIEWEGKPIDCPINVPFSGGHFPRWIHATFSYKACAISIELKKNFINRDTGQLYPERQARLREILKRALHIFPDYPPYYNQIAENNIQTRNGVMKQTHDRYINGKLLEYISRPQYKYGCSIASLTAVFNYLYAEQIGLKTSKELASYLGKSVYTIGTRGNIPNNEDIMNWFESLVRQFHLKGSCSVYLRSKNVENWSNNTEVITGFKECLRNNNNAFIYNLPNHYNLVLGYFEHAQIPEEAFEKEIAYENHIELDRWIILGEHTPSSSPIWCIRWGKIRRDLIETPNHCIMLFRKEEN